MTDDEKQAIERLRNGKKMDLINIIRTFKREGIENFVVTKKETVETILNLTEKQQDKIKKYKEMYAVSVADRVNSAFEQKYKNDEDLEMLYKGCQIEIEKNDKAIDLMAKYIARFDIEEDICNKIEDNCYDYAGQNGKLCNDCIKEYFKKKVEGIC